MLKGPIFRFSCYGLRASPRELFPRASYASYPGGRRDELPRFRHKCRWRSRETISPMPFLIFEISFSSGSVSTTIPTTSIPGSSRISMQEISAKESQLLTISIRRLGIL